jgi:hypothetical protein
MDDFKVDAMAARRGVCDPLQWPGDLVRQVDRFLFGASQWVSPGALRARIEATQAVPPNALPLDLQSLSAGQLQRLADRVAPIGDIELRRLTRDWHSRLALLDAQHWMDLGFTLSVLPFCGHVQRSMDGNFRRALRDQFGVDAAGLLDEQAGKGPALKFLLGPGAWKYPQRVAAGGVSAAMAQLCDWGGAVRQRFALQFDPQVLAAPASVEGLDETSLEIACKLTLQDHPWLWS